MGIVTAVSVEDIRSRGSIKDSDVLKLQRAFQDGPGATAEDAEQLFALDAACRVKDPAWYAFLIETVTDCIVCQVKPEGYMVRDKAAWLIRQLATHGQVGTRAGLDVLCAVMRRSRWSPPSLAVFGLGLVKTAVVTGDGPLRTGTPEPAAIMPSEVSAIAELLDTFGGAATLPVTRAEADVLIDINRALAPGNSSPAWTELFVKAVGNAALSGLGMSVPDRRAALASDAWLVEGDATLSSRRIELARPNPIAASRSFAGRMIAGGAGSVWASCRLQSSEERALMRLERQRREIITGEPIAEPDEAWLLSRLGNARDLGDNEIALLAFLRREAHELPPSLAALGATIAA